MQGRRLQFSLRSLLLFSTGVCVAASTIALWAKAQHDMGLSHAVAIRALGATAVAMIVGALSGSLVRAMVGTAVGMLVADVVYIRYFAGNSSGASDTREFLLNPVLLVCVVPGALASFRAWLVGLAACMFAAAPLIAAYALAEVNDYLHPPPPTAKHWAEWRPLLLLFIGPAMAAGGSAWLIARASLAGIQRLYSRQTNSSGGNSNAETV